jgi:hypothetical protein
MEQQNQIPREAFSEYGLRNNVAIPGYFNEGPAHYDETLFDGSPLSVVDSLIPVIKTKDSISIVAAIRSEKEKAQPNAASMVTARQTHAGTRRVVGWHEPRRVPILGSPSHTVNEVYHIDDVMPIEPTLVADYEPGGNLAKSREVLEPSFRRLTDKTLPDNGTITEFHDTLINNSTIWLGSTVIGVSEVGLDRFEPTRMGSIFAVLDMSDRTDEEVRRMLQPNVHYRHFDLIRPGLLHEAVQNNLIHQFAQSVEGDEVDMYAFFCVQGLCVRIAVVSLHRHIKQINKILDTHIFVPPLTASRHRRKLYRLPHYSSERSIGSKA